ncbi:MAG: hypothetical protein ABIB79_02625 [archaeon]
MKKKVLLILIVLFMSAYLVIAADEDCEPDWRCTPYSECITGTRIRSCVDFNTCGINEDKPAESEDCSDCTPNWDCTDWKPEVCPRDGVQTMTCNDLNACGTVAGKPAEIKLCTYDPGFDWMFALIIVIISTMIVGDSILIVKQWRKINIIQNRNKVFQRPVPMTKPKVSVK